MRGTSRLVVVLAATMIFLGGSNGAEAATLKASYQLQGNRLSAVAGAPELTDLGAGNRFAFEAIDGVSRQVLKFQKGNGLALATAGLVDPRNHSVVVLFRLAEISGFRRILDFSDSRSDDGLYNLSGRVALYGKVASIDDAVSQGIVFDDSYAQVILTNAAVAGSGQETIAYVNGTRVAAARTTQGFDLRSGVLRFFQDNTSGPAGGEESAGAVACVLVYDGALTAGEVGQITGDPTLCPAPDPIRRAQALATGEPGARRSGRSIMVDTGLTVSCPIGTTSCAASGRVDVAPRGGRARAARTKRLGVVKFSLPAGASRDVVVQLSERGAKALRETGALRIRVSAEIAAAGGRRATAQQMGRIRAPRRPRFRVGTYTGTTSQGLPIFVGVGRRAIQSVYFRWRLRCADGQVHTNTIFLGGRRVRRGRFSFERVLESGGSVHVSGRIRGAHVWGTLSRMGASAFGTECTARKIRWRARYSGGEDQTSR